VTDGSQDGTYATDIKSRSSFDKSIIFKDKLYFESYDEEFGEELWVTDATQDGTYLFKDIIPTNNNISINTESLTVVEDKLFFTGYNREFGEELWVTDATLEGTYLVKDIISGTRSSNPKNLTSFDKKLFFTVENSEYGSDLWVSDGTSEGTNLIQSDIDPKSDGVDPGNFTIFEDKLYFSSNSELWKVEVNDIQLGSTGDLIEGSDNLSVFDNQVVDIISSSGSLDFDGNALISV